LDIVKPPYTITEMAKAFLTKIEELLVHLEYGTGFKKNIQLHMENRLRTIHSSCAIEGNNLSLSEVRDIISGKAVIGTPKDIQEVKNAYDTYAKLMSFDPYSITDFLEAHRLMTDGLISESGKFRSGDVGVYSGGTIVHMGARPHLVQGLIANLFAWAKQSELHPIFISTIIHYEIEVIHPFADGNGRMGRLWHTLLLAKWKEVLAWLPMESTIYNKRPQYYKALQDSGVVNDCAIFMEYCLSAILETITIQFKQQEKALANLSEIQKGILKILQKSSLSRKEIFAAIGISGDSRAYKRHIEPLMALGLIEMTVPDKPNSRVQRYRIVR